MAKKRIKKDSEEVRCPFFRGETMAEIRCEGFFRGCSIHVAFADKSEKRSFMKNACEYLYTACPIYKLCDRKYDDFGKTK